MFKKIILFIFGFLFCLGLLARCTVTAHPRKDADAKKLAAELKARGVEGNQAQVEEFLKKGK
ncbi:MAG: hypothetical protein M1547_03120 [Gammaproteobacteria bacterium]|nr:hypothetical protein [Gammaproteobacteria bacterium]